MKFKQVNIRKLCVYKNCSYFNFDLLRQTTIKRIVENEKNKTKEELIKNILCNVYLLLDNMIMED